MSNITQGQFDYYSKEAMDACALAVLPEESMFWAGYLRGLRFALTGESFGNAEEKRLWTFISGDVYREARRKGYRAGCSGMSVKNVKLTVQMEEWKIETSRRLKLGITEKEPD